jgi:hypothetical protein
MHADAGTEGQVGHRHGERTRGRGPGLGGRRLAPGRGRRTAATATDLHGEQGGGPEEGPQSAEADAPLPRQRVVERAAGNGGQRWPQDGRGRRTHRARGLGEGRHGRLDPAGCGRVEAPAGQAGVHPEGRRETARARYSRDRRQRAAGPDGGGAGARVGGPVRVPIVWVPAGPLVSGRGAGRLRDRTGHDLQAPVGAGCRPGRRVRPD